MRTVNSKQLTVNNLAFTLIELLVVVSIIGILAVLVMANLNSARSRARDAARKSDLRNISTALRLYYNDKATFPATFTFGAPFTSGSTTYMEAVPQDSLYPDQAYKYTQTPGGDGFALQACLENSSDKQGIPKSGITCPGTLMFQVTQ
ncbi:MAG: prepilin-type N-terminal cleavage/methylation domain-containing protein [Candidatus Woesebacteria bacterium]|nr:prepilin-type N-terminal cleavage/methylation domain-containing protein [Candidatus Woesebacteria bacterium]